MPTTKKARNRADLRGRGLPFLKVFRDPVHDLISLGPEDEFILNLIDTREFQRLRRIRQLGLAHFVYPGAEHTRFVHSLGVFNFARRMIEQLRCRHSADGEIVKVLADYAKTIKAAALLHDLGHGPFSHVYERVFPGSWSHERWACEILRDSSTEIGQRLRAAVKLGDVLSLIWGEAHEHHADAKKVEQPFLRDVVSSQLDADRMDYLLRDSMMTGSQYGRYDCSWILNALAIGEVLWAGKYLKKLCLDKSKGTGAIEGFLLARSLMTQHVYGHKTTRAFESELLCTLRLAAEHSAELPDGTPEPVLEMLRKRGKLTVKAYLAIDDEVTWWALRRWATWDPPKRNKRLIALSEHASNLVRRIEPWRTHELLPAQFPAVKAMISELDRTQDAMRFECWADDGKVLPYKDLMLALSSGDPEQAFFADIFLMDRTGNIEPLSSMRPQPPILEALTKATWKYRLFYNRRLKQKFAGLLGKHGVSLT